MTVKIGPALIFEWLWEQCGIKEVIQRIIRGRKFEFDKDSATIDADKVKGEARFEGKWVLRTNTNLPAEKVALKYKELW